MNVCVCMNTCMYVCLYVCAGDHSVGAFCVHRRLSGRVRPDFLVADIGDIPSGSAGQGGVCSCGMFEVTLCVCMYVCVYVYVYKFMYVWINVCMYVCMYL